MPGYSKPSVTVDIVVFCIFDDELKVLLIRRGKPPYQDRWALPGGFVEIDESLALAARRELMEETGLKAARLKQLYTFGDPGRDPRGRTISVVYSTHVRAGGVRLKASTDASDAAWFPALRPPRLAFDHNKILRHAIQSLQLEIENGSVAPEFLPPRFTLAELRRAHEIVLNLSLIHI